MPGLGGSLLLIAVGAILTWAVTVRNPHGFDINTAGVILLIIGAVGLVISLIWLALRRRTEVVDRSRPGAGRHTYTPPRAGY